MKKSLVKGEIKGKIGVLEKVKALGRVKVLLLLT